MTEPDASEVEDPIERADEEFERLKEESERRADRTAEFDQELERDAAAPDPGTTTAAG